MSHTTKITEERSKTDYDYNVINELVLILSKTKTVNNIYKDTKAMMQKIRMQLILY